MLAQCAETAAFDRVFQPGPPGGPAEDPLDSSTVPTILYLVPVLLPVFWWPLELHRGVAL